MAVDSDMIHSVVDTVRSLIGGLMTTVTIKNQTKLNDYGEPIFGTGTGYRAVLTKRERKVISRDGSEVVSSLTVLIPESISVSVTDQITLPDGSKPPILAVESSLDSTGKPYIVKIYI